MPEDAAFTWDSAPARPARRTPAAAPAAPPPAAEPAASPPEPEPERVEWVTLRQAADAVGMAPGTIRRWAARGRVPTKLADTDDGVRRMVGLAEVHKWAEVRSTPRSTPAPTPAPAVPSAGDDHMLVPRQAWEKVLAQLGNLHEAGQQLAEARERAAKAETEAAFLRERLAELRAGSPQPPAPAPAEPDPSAQPPRPRWRRLLGR